ncbi:hypothetical protein DdX_11326 [Ditylenchus destructor]|uniref:RRM domain-containing protein n=1 Tax=Ditylenchus destructor TaxID=166010 RepID=A0AAD4N0Q5_9BILA|nr:hypothetical protein DdX_11326 [Ditylenchus destructor]
MMEPPMADVSTSSANDTPVATPTLDSVDESSHVASESPSVSDVNLQVPKGLSGQHPGSDLEALLKQHEEIIDWNAAVETAITENPSLLKADPELSDAVKKPPVAQVLEFRPPFYAFITGISFQAKKEDIYYFFGGPKKLEDVHIYTNPPHGNLPGRFSGDAMLKLKSLNALIDVLKMDGEELFSRCINVYHVMPGSRDRKRYTALQLENVRLAPVYHQNDRGHYRQDSRASAGHVQRESYSPRQGNQPPARNAYPPPQQQKTQHVREKFMPKRESNDVRAFQQQGQVIYQQPQPSMAHHQGPPQPRQSMHAPYPPQGGYNRVPPSGQTWTENTAMEIKEKPAPVQRQSSADIFGTKPVDTSKKMLEIQKKLESEQTRTPRESESSVHHQPPHYGDRRSGEYRQPGGHNRMSSNSSSMQSLSQQQQFQPTRILTNTNHQYQQRKQSIESSNYPVPLNQCHPNSRESTQHLDAAPSQPRSEIPETNQWDNSMAEQVLNADAVSRLDSEVGREQMQHHTGGGPKRQMSGTGRSGSESSANYQQGPAQHYQREQQPFHPNQKTYKKQPSRESTGGGVYSRRPQQYQQQRSQRSDNRDIREERGRVDKYPETQKSDLNENKAVRDDERHHQQQLRTKQGGQHHHKGPARGGGGGQDRGGSPRRSPPRVAKESIHNIQNYIQKENQNAKVSDSQSHDQQSQPPSGQNTLRRHNKRTFVNQSRDNRHKDHKYEDGPHMPANVRKKQSMDSKLDETVRDGQQKEPSQSGGKSNYHYGGRGGGPRQNRSDSTPSNIDSTQKITQEKPKDIPKEASKEVNEQPPPDPVSSTLRASVQQTDAQQQDNVNSPQKNPSTPPANGGGSTKKKDSKKKAKKDAGASSVTTQNKFSALTDCKEFEV